MLGNQKSQKHLFLLTFPWTLLLQFSSDTPHQWFPLLYILKSPAKVLCSPAPSFALEGWELCACAALQSPWQTFATSAGFAHELQPLSSCSPDKQGEISCVLGSIQIALSLIAFCRIVIKRPMLHIESGNV